MSGAQATERFRLPSPDKQEPGGRITVNGGSSVRGSEAEVCFTVAGFDNQVVLSFRAHPSKERPGLGGGGKASSQ